jgi:hypothetical protein
MAAPLLSTSLPKPATVLQPASPIASNAIVINAIMRMSNVPLNDDVCDQRSQSRTSEK